MKLGEGVPEQVRTNLDVQAGLRRTLVEHLIQARAGQRTPGSQPELPQRRPGVLGAHPQVSVQVAGGPGPEVTYSWSPPLLVNSSPAERNPADTDVRS
jgi:hypothetical protein